MTLGELNRSLGNCANCGYHNYSVIHETSLDTLKQVYRLRCNICRKETFSKEFVPEENMYFNLLENWNMISDLHKQQQEAKDGSPRKEEDKDLSRFRVEE